MKLTLAALSLAVIAIVVLDEIADRRVLRQWRNDRDRRSGWIPRMV